MLSSIKEAGSLGFWLIIKFFYSMYFQVKVAKKSVINVLIFRSLSQIPANESNISNFYPVHGTRKSTGFTHIYLDSKKKYQTKRMLYRN